MAWHSTPAVPGERILAAPTHVESFSSAARGADGEVTGIVPRFEVIPGISLLNIGDKSAGLDGASNLVTWGMMYERGFGIEGQIVLRRPPRSAASLATGDTLMVVRGTLETYAGKTYALGLPDDLVIYGGWLEGRTLLQSLDARGRWRPYLQYGGGVMVYAAEAVNGIAHWDSTIAVGWRTALGLEFRLTRLGFYAEAGIQTLGPPNVAEGYLGNQAETDRRTAQNLLTYPIRLGAMIGF